MACPNQRFKQMLPFTKCKNLTLKEKMEAMTTMIAFIFISLVAQTDGIRNRVIKESIDVLDEKITAMMGEIEQKIVVLEEEVNNLSRIFSRPCSDGWSEFESSCYRLVEKKMSWDNAMMNCKDLGGYLAEVESKEEDVFINNFFKIHEEYTWIGGNDRDVEGQWYWGHSKRPLGFTNWNKNEPNGHTRENCIHYLSPGKWNDAPCNLRFVSICERPI